ncbi:MAG: 30S ribosomal protein S1 [Gammaproteobacteria bacterium RIFCSPLOWO2_02_FULL_42_9]|nr:MAG: 30S ribosomal protein S1 [Gammaproteobacteria bacterium RIFCSPLOWO2_02_FULL_42_9]
MSESFAELFQESLTNFKMRPGDLIKGRLVGFDGKYALIDVGLKSEGVVPIDQFMNADKELDAKVGDEVDVVVDALVDAYGETRLSREKAKRAAAWLRLVEAHEKNTIVQGVVSSKVKGGFTVEVQGVRAFLPGSLVDVRPIEDDVNIEGKEFDFKIIKVDEKRNNIVVSRRAVLEAESSVERSKLLEHLEEGKVIKGVVKNLTDYGAFIDLGGVDGLLHITDISWRRIKLPSEVLKMGDEVTVVVLKFDKDRSRVSLGMKQLAKDPWLDIKTRYPVGTRLTGKVTNLTDYGCFVEIEEGVEGLVHMSEMDWTNKNIRPSKLVQVGTEVDVVVLDMDEDRRRISLGMKQCEGNPWSDFSEKHAKGDRVSGQIKSITDFGIFVGLDGNIDGLVHLSDISWEEPGEQAVQAYKKGGEIETVILAIDPARERISLGIKQLQNDPFNNYLSEHEKGTVVKGRIVELDKKQAIVELTPDVKGRIKASEIAIEKVEDATEYLKVGEEVEAKIIGVGRKDRLLNLSIRAMYEAAASKSSEEQAINPTLGDLLKEKMQDDE